MNEIEYALLLYITLNRRVKKSDLTVSNLSGWFDYYYRLDVTEEEIDASLRNLTALCCIEQIGTSYVPVEAVKKIRKKTRFRFTDLFGIGENAERRFCRLIYEKYGVRSAKSPENIGKTLKKDRRNHA
ncbi:MAG: hypothetical protein ACI3XR_01290 [Eubacteriales bacterium]